MKHTPTLKKQRIMTQISPLAFIDPGARIGNNVRIAPFAYIAGDTVIGDNCHIHPHVSVLEGAVIGNDCEVFDGAVISATPQDFRWKGARSFVKIGDNTTVRDHVIINRSIRDNQATEIGANSFVMAQSHIGHDSTIGDYVVLGNSVKIAGDCKVGNFSILSSNALVHERCEVGEWVLVKGGTRVNSHVPPYVVVAHNPLAYYGVNAFILRKGKFTEAVIDDIAKCYRHIYQCNTSVLNAVRRIQEDIPEGKERDAILAFIRNHNMKIAGVPEMLLED